MFTYLKFWQCFKVSRVCGVAVVVVVVMFMVLVMFMVSVMLMVLVVFMVLVVVMVVMVILVVVMVVVVVSTLKGPRLSKGHGPQEQQSEGELHLRWKGFDLLSVSINV